jgi:hypothetical protein
VIREGLAKDDSESEDSADESTVEEEYTQQTVEATTEKWALKKGTIPDHNDYPVLHQFGTLLTTNRQLSYYYRSYKSVKNKCKAFYLLE